MVAGDGMQRRVLLCASLAALGRAEEAGAELRAARVVVDEIAALFTDADLRAHFVANAAGRLAAATP